MTILSLSYCLFSLIAISSGWEAHTISRPRAEGLFADSFESGDTTRWSAAVPVTPDRIDNLWGWWDAGFGATIKVGENLETPPKEVSRAIGWKDRSGNGRDFFASFSHAPVYVPTAHAGLPALEWRRKRMAWLSLDDFIDPSQSGIEAFIVARSKLSLESSSVLQQRDRNGTGRAWLHFNGSALMSRIGGPALTSPGAVDVFKVNIYQVSYDLAAGTLRLYRNGELLTSANGVAGEPSQGSLYLGRNKSGHVIDGFIQEIVIYDRALETGERSAIVDYLRQKYALDWPQPSVSPTAVNGLWAWWRADVGVSMESGVSEWEDQSGNGVTLSQPDPSRQPALTPNAQNGLPAITFDDVNDHLENVSRTLDFSTEDATFFFVMNTSDSQASSPMGTLDGPTGQGRAIFENEFDAGRVYIGGFPAPLSLDFGTVTGPAVLTVFYDGNAGVTQYAVNDWIWGLATDVAGEANPDGGIRVGDSRSDGNDFHGDIHEIVVFNRALSWSERQGIINYLNDRWAIY